MGRRSRATAATAAEAATAAGDSQHQPVRKRQRVQKPEQLTNAAVQTAPAQTAAEAGTKAAANKPGRKKAAAAVAAANKPGKKKAAAGAAAAAGPAAKAAAAAVDDDAWTSGSREQQFYLVKSEPDAFSIDQLEAREHQTEGWDGVRNAQARNTLRSMRPGDLAFFYHSSCKVPGIVGIVKVVREAYPDVTAFDPASQYYDASSSRDNPKWWQVDLQLVRRLARQVSLEELKAHKQGSLAGMALFNRPRLSVQHVSKEEWQFVLGLEGQEAPAAATKAGASGRGRKGKASSKQEGSKE